MTSQLRFPRLRVTAFLAPGLLAFGVILAAGADAQAGGRGGSGGGIVHLSVHGPGSSHNPIVHHPVHGSGSSHNPIVHHPVHGSGSSHNPIVTKPLPCRRPGTCTPPRK